jgi:hypothetical protein
MRAPPIAPALNVARGSRSRVGTRPTFWLLAVARRRKQKPRVSGGAKWSFECPTGFQIGGRDRSWPTHINFEPVLAL